MLGPTLNSKNRLNKKIIDEVIRRDVESTRLLNRTFRDEYPKGRGMDCNGNCNGGALMRTSTYNGMGMPMGMGLKTVMNPGVGMPTIGAIGLPRVINTSEMNMEGEGFVDFIKSAIKGVSKAVKVGKKIYDKAKPIAEKVMPIVSDVIQSVKDIKEELKNKPEEENENKEGSGKRKPKSLKQVLKMIENVKPKKGGKKVKSAIINLPTTDMKEIGSGKKKLNPWISFLKIKKMKVKDLPKKGTDEHSKMMIEYNKFKN